jgi:hypothetical protein
MTKPLNNSAWTQGLLEESATQKHPLGILRFTEDGRAFRYAKAGEALSPGKVGQMIDAVALHVKQACPVAAAGTKRIGLTVGATAVTEDYYKDGYLQIYDGTTTGLGMQYRILGNTACDASGVTYVTLEEGIKYALTASDYYSLVANPWSSITQNASLAHGFAGVVPRPVTSAYYFWIQTGGIACCLNGGNTTLGAGFVPSATEGALKTQPDGALDSAPVGYCTAFAAVDTKYCPVMLNID